MGHRGQRLALGLRCEGVHCTQRLRLGTPISPPWSPRQKTVLFPPGPSTGLHMTPESNPSREEKEMLRDGDGVWNERQETRVLLSDLKTKTKTESCFQSDSLPLCLFLAPPCCPTESHFLSLLLGEGTSLPRPGTSVGVGRGRPHSSGRVGAGRVCRLSLSGEATRTTRTSRWSQEASRCSIIQGARLADTSAMILDIGGGDAGEKKIINSAKSSAEDRCECGVRELMREM